MIRNISKQLTPVALVIFVAVFTMGAGLERHKTGFLKNYGQLTPDSTMDGALRYQNDR